MSTSARSRLATLLLTMALLLAAATALPAVALAASPGTGGWYWPTGSENFGGMSGWMAFRGNNWHLAQDMRLAKGKPVFAVGDGLVLESGNYSGFGPAGGSGGAIVILHRTAYGVEFKALYGHLDGLRYKKGQTVKAGAVIGVINGTSPSHVHFGINPGRAYPSDNNPFRGHTYVHSYLYGFVDPVAFLRANPRTVPYHAPAMPQLASVSTTSTPRMVVAAGGTLYWRVTLEDEAQDWAYTIATRVLRQVGEKEKVPAADSRTYALSVTSGPKPSIKVSDRRTIVGLAASTLSPRKGYAVYLSGAALNTKKQVFAGARIVVEAWESGAWRTVATTCTRPNGTWLVRYAPPGARTLRARFLAASPYTGSISVGRTVKPK